MKTGHSEKLSSVIVAVMCAALLIMRAAPPACAAEPRDDDESVRKLLVGLDPNGSQARVAVPRLIAVISDDELSDVVRRQTAMMLARIGDPAREAVPILIELRSDKRSDESGVRFWATKSLGLFGSVAAGAVPILSKELADAMHPAGERLLVADVLGQIGTGPAVQSLARELLRPRDSSDSAETQLLEVAIDAIGQAGPEGIVALPALIRTAAHSRPDVRRKACRTIGRLGPRAELSLDPLLERIVLDDDPAVRDAAAAAMARIGPAAVPVLVRLLDSGLPELQWRAAQSLAQIGPRAEEALNGLKQAAHARSPRVRIECLDAIWRIGRSPGAVTEALIKELLTDDRQIRRRASQLLIELTPLPASALEQLKFIAADDSRDDQRAAGYVLRERLRRVSAAGD